MTLTGLVLAGGRSMRMGRDKALLPWGAATLLDHMLAILRDAGATRCLVSGARDGYDAIADRYPDLGPVGGIASAAAALGPGRLLVVPVDMPLLDASMLKPLATSEGACAHWDASRLPMALTLSPSSRAVIEYVAALPGRSRSLHAIQAALDTRVLVTVQAHRARLSNANTPEEWSTLAP